jgi:hypothetical protein
MRAKVRQDSRVRGIREWAYARLIDVIHREEDR